MASITPQNQDVVTFTTWAGHMRRPQLQGGSDQRLGSGTVLAYVTGSRAERSVIQVTLLADSADSASQLARKIENCKNRVCLVVNDFDQEFPVCLCHEARVDGVREGKSASGLTHLIQASLELEVLEDQIAQNTIPGQ